MSVRSNKIIECLKAGMRNMDIARQVGVSRAYVSMVKKKNEDNPEIIHVRRTEAKSREISQTTLDSLILKTVYRDNLVAAVLDD